jgi:hypothetical protein
MAAFQGINVAENWTAVSDQLTAEVARWRSQDGLIPGVLAWVEGAAREVAAIVAEDFADVDPDTVRRLLVQGGALIGTVMQAAEPDSQQAVAMAQTVMAVALFGQPGGDS